MRASEQDEIIKTRRILYGMVAFWLVVTSIILIISTAAALTDRPALLHSSEGALMVLGVIAYIGWYLGANRFLMQGRDPHWKSTFRWQRLLYLAVLLLINMGLVAISAEFKTVYWVEFGIGLSIATIPWNMLIALVPGLLALSQYTPLWPVDNSPEAWIGFAGTILSFIIYTGIVTFPVVVLRHRFERERTMRELEAAHADLRAAHAQLALSADHERELAVLRERERLAREMHDTLGSALVLASVKLDAARRLAAVDPDRADHEIATTQEVVRGAMAELRATLAELRSPALQRDTLTSALACFARAAGERGDLTVEVQVCEAANDWSEAIQTAIYRIGVEAITNVERHAHATSLQVHMTMEDDIAQLVVRDDGVGLPELPVTATGEITGPSGHFGLAGIRERIATLDGTMEIRSAAGAGTAIIVTLPLRIIASVTNAA